MIYLKSVFAGLLTVLLGTVLFLIGGAAYFAFAYSGMPEGTSIGWDPISFLHQSVYVWIAFALLFLIGFAWQFRRGQTSH